MMKMVKTLENHAFIREFVTPFTAIYNENPKESYRILPIIFRESPVGTRIRKINSEYPDAVRTLCGGATCSHVYITNYHPVGYITNYHIFPWRSGNS